MKLIKEIKSKKKVLHFRRWELFSCKYFSIYIHGIYKEDNDKHLHNHPWNIFTIILKGSYIEEVLDKDSSIFNTRKFLNFSFRDRTQYHKIKELLSKDVYTLAVVFGKRDDQWGYNVDGSHIDNINYRK